MAVQAMTRFALVQRASLHNGETDKERLTEQTKGGVQQQSRGHGRGEGGAEGE